MKAAGIICEYNPFHRAHRYHIEETRRAVGEDAVIVCCMSGHFVQRGEPGMFSPAVRAEAALKSGADLVVELPLPWAMAPAERFARGGVSLLAGCGCDTISFGSETEDVEHLIKIANAIDSEETEAFLRQEMEKGLSYAAAREKALRRVMGKEADAIGTPNNILAVEYLRAVKKLNAPLQPLAILRKGPSHDSQAAVEEYASASHIREMMLDGRPWKTYVPEETAALLEQAMAKGAAPVTLSSLENLILYRLRTMTDGEYAALPDDSEGLSRRLMRYGRSAATLEEVLQQTKTKRYAMARIKRMALAALLHMTEGDTEGLPPYIRVLGFTERGQKHLRTLRGGEMPVLLRAGAVKKLDDRAMHIFRLEARAADIYGLGTAGTGEGGALWRQNTLMP